MLAGQVSIRLEARPGLALKTGEVLNVQVLNRLEGGRWAVGILGRVVPATSEVPLTSGSRLLARVVQTGGRVSLRVLDRAPASPLSELAVRTGLDTDPATARLLAAFLASGLKARPEAVEQARRLLERLRLPPERFARLAALALDKGIDLGSPGIEELLPLLGYGEGGGRRQGRRRSPPFRQGPEEVEEAIRRQSTEGEEPEATPLPLFNHLKGSREHWVVVPFRYAELSGTIRLRLPAEGKRADRLVLRVQDAEGECWSFVLDQGAPTRPSELQAFATAGAAGRRAQGKWRELAQKLQNLGVNSDDIIRVDDEFDGFTEYREIDTVG